ETNFYENFKKNGKAEINKKFQNKTGKYKYENVINGKELEHQFVIHPRDETDKQSSWKSKFQPLDYVKFAENDFGEQFAGHIVCVGQATNYDENNSRKGEYVFNGNKTDVINNESKRIKLSKDKFNDFKFINLDNTSDEIDDWTYWKKEIGNGIPVFFRVEEKSNEVKDLGLTFMYKQPAKNSVHELEPYKSYKLFDKKKEEYEPDLCETIFGYEYKDISLKGRVFISKADLISEPNFIEEQAVVLSSPRSSFYPFYLKQNGRNGVTQKYNNYNNASNLSGFKRYPVHSKSLFNKMKKDGMSEKMVTKFNPLKEGSIFKSKIRFHNLRKVEIGALLSALTFHNTKNTFHSLGYAKPLGFGKMKVETKLLNLKYSFDDYLEAYEFEMRKKITNWGVSARLTELISMASENELDIELDYMDINDFQSAKNEGKYLSLNTGYLKNSVRRINTCINEEVFQNKLKKAKAKKEQVKKEKDEKIKKEFEVEKNRKIKPFINFIGNAEKHFKNEDFENAKLDFINALNEHSLIVKDYPNEFNNEVIEIREKINLCNDKAELEIIGTLKSYIKEVEDFEALKKHISTYLDKGGKIKHEDYDSIKEIIKKHINNLSSKKLKRWQKFPKKDWVLVLNWVDKQTAQNWYNELIEK
ncbi:MAG: TIGR03986 family CRISPR-associated RAMP protein, partial [Bacteroidota bacterium]|nr:TIGR03986 family CRISPR-associated RAMP protein [Bacteroidota bacterium]